MSLRYSYQPHNARQRPLYEHPLQELQAEEEVEVEAEAEAEVEAEAEAEEEVEANKQTTLPRLTSDSAETLQKYSQEKERKQIASSPNSNVII